MCLIYIRDQLNEVNRLQSIILSAIWIMYGNLLIEKQTSIMSTDIIHNYLTNVVCEIEIISFFCLKLYFYSLDLLFVFLIKLNLFDV